MKKMQAEAQKHMALYPSFCTYQCLGVHIHSLELFKNYFQFLQICFTNEYTVIYLTFLYGLTF